MHIFVVIMATAVKTGFIAVVGLSQACVCVILVLKISITDEILPLIAPRHFK